MGAKGIRCSVGTKGARWNILSSLPPNTILKSNPNPNAHPNPQPSPNPTPTPSPNPNPISVPQEFHCPLPQGCEAVSSKRSTAHCPRAVRQCTEGVPLPTAPRRDNLREEFRCLLPPGSAAVCRGSSTAHSPTAVRQCAVGTPLPTAPVPGNS